MALALAAQDAVSVSGVLNRVMAIGGETTGWALQLDEGSKLDGKPVSEVEVTFPNQAKLREWSGKRVKMTARLARRTGVERGERSVLEIATIEGAGERKGLARTIWILAEMDGLKVVDGVTPTLEFQSATDVGGNGSCNRFSATVKVESQTLIFGPIRMTRKACATELMRQERRYLELLGEASRWEMAGGELLIYSRIAERPLRFLKSDKL